MTLGLALFLSLYLFHGCESKSAKLAIGREAPNFTYLDLSGGSKELREFRGKVVILRFWADWCPYCAVEMPIIEKVYQELKDKGLGVLAVNVKQSEASTRTYVEKLGVTYPIALDRDGKITELYEVKGIPVNFIINKQGVLKELIVGAITDVTMLKEFLDPYLQEVQTSTSSPKKNSVKRGAQ
jgi:cytochrome c biogenesis protein CcmG, thiol:disulfide interchange protein DsbE